MRLKESGRERERKREERKRGTGNRRSRDFYLEQAVVEHIIITLIPLNSIRNAYELNTECSLLLYQPLLCMPAGMPLISVSPPECIPCPNSAAQQHSEAEQNTDFRAENVYKLPQRNIRYLFHHPYPGPSHNNAVINYPMLINPGRYNTGKGL